MPDFNTQLTGPLSTAISGPFIPSAARTTLITDTVPDENIADARGIVVYLVVTAASGTGGLTLQVKGIPPFGGVGVLLHAAPTAVIATGTTSLTIYPGLPAPGSAGANTANAVLPPRISIGVGVGDASSYTYSVSAYLLG